jgi:hypothetical protein
VGTLPDIKVKDLAIWESVLKAGAALQMDGMIRHIIQRLSDDSSQLLRSDAARFMRLVMDYDASFYSLDTHLVGALCVFAFRRQPISSKEFSILGEKMSALAHHTREAVRDCFLLDQANLISLIQSDPTCSQKQDCRTAIFRNILENITTKATYTLNTDIDQSDIFRIVSELGICGVCRLKRSEYTHTIMSYMIERVVKKKYLDIVSAWRGEGESNSGL